MLEVGIGTGWLEIACALRGLRCRGIEINPLLIEHAHAFARRHGVEIDVALGNIESVHLPSEAFDVVVASSVFEHVEHYERALARVYRALRPGGVLYFYSTNRFSVRSGEFPALPLYGWLPDPVRRRFRVWRHGPGIVESSGIDFNQFTYWGLERLFTHLGFSRVLDRTQFVEGRDDLMEPAPWKVAVTRLAKVQPARTFARVFASGNAFICVK